MKRLIFSCYTSHPLDEMKTASTSIYLLLLSVPQSSFSDPVAEGGEAGHNWTEIHGQSSHLTDQRHRPGRYPGYQYVTVSS